MSKTWKKKKKWYDDYDPEDNRNHRGDRRISSRKNKRMIRYDGNSESEEDLTENFIISK